MKSAFRLSGMNFNLKTTSADWEMLSSRFTASVVKTFLHFEIIYEDYSWNADLALSWLKIL